MTTSRLPGFKTASPEARRAALARLLGRSIDELSVLNPGAITLEWADKLIENVVGIVGLPVGIGTNFMVNGQEMLIPMAVEEPSVVAGFSNACKIARAGGGFSAEADPSHMIGQLQISVPHGFDPEEVGRKLEAGAGDISAAAGRAAASMTARGGGLVRLEQRRLDDPEGGPPMLILHLVVDVVDAMGANAVNHIAEAVAPTVERIAGLPVGLRILSNLADQRLARAECRIPFGAIGGEEVAARIAEADRFARLDPHRAATHNKGILNGIDAVAVATGNDWRALEAGAHAYAAREGRYRGLTRWVLDQGALAGRIELPLAVGTVGGITRSHPTIALLSALIGAESARTLAAILAAVGLAQNLAALRALAAEGIQRGHMALHARQLALAAGALPEEVDRVVERTIESGRVSADVVAKALEKERGQS